jgi:hypothetical protein
MSDVSRIVIRPHPAIPPEDARDVRARALRYAFERYHEKQSCQDRRRREGSWGATGPQESVTRILGHEKGPLHGRALHQHLERMVHHRRTNIYA